MLTLLDANTVVRSFRAYLFPNDKINNNKIDVISCKNILVFERFDYLSASKTKHCGSVKRLYERWSSIASVLCESHQIEPRSRFYFTLKA